jgi:hypothetical protein
MDSKTKTETKTEKTETEKPLQELIGSSVIVRDHMAGLYAGVLTYIDLAARTWTMRDARLVHYWSRAAAVPGVAMYGPGPGSRVCPAVPVFAGNDLVGICPLSVESEKILREYPEWSPK